MLLTRARVRGREHLRVEGPVIYAANHVSTFDALLLVVLLPVDTVFVGPGDFRLLWPGNWAIRIAGLVPMKRGAVDREGLKRLLDVLKGGGRLGMFPEGGTWEKPIHDVKPGVAYLSQASGARIVPMGFGGTYQVWGQIARLRRPRIDVTIGAPLPPVAVSADRRSRQDALQAASIDLMHHIYTLLPPGTQAHYDRMARLRFTGTLVFDPPEANAPNASLDALAELVAKPNLFSPLVHNARLPVTPFAHPGRAVPVPEMRAAVDALQAAFASGDFAGYLEYRLGEDKAGQIRAALAAICAALDGQAGSSGRVAFHVAVHEAEPDAGSG